MKVQYVPDGSFYKKKVGTEVKQVGRIESSPW